MAGWLGTEHDRPSDIMRDVLTGKLDYNDAPVSVQSMCSYHFHQAAVEILGLPENKMKKALDRVPETCRMQVRKRMLELWREK